MNPLIGPIADLLPQRGQDRVAAPAGSVRAGIVYKMGKLRIMQLRKEAQQKLGSRFDLREFHDRILRSGVLPLDL